MTEMIQADANVGLLGEVSVEIDRTTTGTALRAKVRRPREADESWEQAALHAAQIAAVAYRQAVNELQRAGLTPGKDPK